MSTGTVNPNEQSVVRSKRQKQSRKKPQYPIPESKLTTHETEGFDVQKHAKLSLRDFADPLCYYKWLEWYYNELSNLAAIDAEKFASMNKLDTVERVIKKLKEFHPGCPLQVEVNSKFQTFNIKEIRLSGGSGGMVYIVIE